MTSKTRYIFQIGAVVVASLLLLFFLYSKSAGQQIALLHVGRKSDAEGEYPSELSVKLGGLITPGVNPSNLLKQQVENIVFDVNRRLHESKEEHSQRNHVNNLRSDGNIKEKRFPRAQRDRKSRGQQDRQGDHHDNHKHGQNPADGQDQVESGSQEREQAQIQSDNSENERALEEKAKTEQADVAKEDVQDTVAIDGHDKNALAQHHRQHSDPNCQKPDDHQDDGNLSEQKISTQQMIGESDLIVAEKSDALDEISVASLKSGKSADEADQVEEVAEMDAEEYDEASLDEEEAGEVNEDNEDEDDEVDEVDEDDETGSDDESNENEDDGSDESDSDYDDEELDDEEEDDSIEDDGNLNNNAQKKEL